MTGLSMRYIVTDYKLLRQQVVTQALPVFVTGFACAERFGFLELHTLRCIRRFAALVGGGGFWSWTRNRIQIRL